MIGFGGVRSITRRFLLIILSLFTLGTLAALAASWIFAGVAAEDAHDRLLLSAAVQIIDSIGASAAGFSVSPPDAVFETFALSSEDRFFYSVRAPGGRLMTGYRNLPDAGGGGEGVTRADGFFARAPVRIVTLRRQVGLARGTPPATVTVAQTLSTRQAMQLQLFSRVGPVLLSIAALGLAISLAAARLAVRPMLALERLIAAREPHDLSPIESAGPAEMDAVVAALNALVRRGAQRQEQLRQFVGLAAHQLGTALAAFGAQLDLLAHERDGEGGAGRIAKLRARLDEVSRLIQQLLGHAMVAYRGEAAPRQPVDLVQLTRSVALADVPLSLSRDIEVALDTDAEAIVVRADEVMLREAIANLVGNAALHGARTRIALSVRRREGGAAIHVADDGAGMSAYQWRDASRPFALKRDGAAGAGLGLSIAHETAERHGGALTCGHDADGLFVVVLDLPAGEGE